MRRFLLLGVVLAFLAVRGGVDGGSQSHAGDSSPKPPAVNFAAGERPIESLYKKLCARCHGDDGRGEGKRSKTPLPDLSSAAWQARRTDSQVLASLRNGLGVAMPAFDDRLSPAQAREMVTYVRELCPDQTVGFRGTKGSFDVELQRLERELESLGRQVRKLDKGR